MAEPDWNPDTAGRPLAEILREAGIDTSRSARRRRWDDPDDTGIRQRGTGEDESGQSRPAYGRRLGDLSDTGDDTGRSRGARSADTGRSRGARSADTGRPRPDRSADTGRSRAARSADTGRAPRVAADPSTAAIPGLRPSQRPEVPTTSSVPAARGRNGDQGAGGKARERGPRSGPQRAARPAKSPALADAGPAGARTGRRAAVDEDFSTGPIPVVADPMLEAGQDAGPREGALAWLRFAGELLIALAAGVGVYFLATVLWEQLPQVAVLLAPLAVTGLVAGVSMWRQRLGREPVGARLLAVLVFAGALLTIAPAAQLLAGR